MIDLKIAKEIVEICRRLHARNMLASADGNVSIRISSDKILITPSGINKGFIKPSDLSVMTLGNQVLDGAPSGERLLHLEVYKLCPKARCVVHAHPPTAIAWSVAHPQLRELPPHALSEVILAVGSIPIVPYARPTTAAVAEGVRPYLPSRRAMILARHGALSWGETADEAYNGMERIEHAATILATAVSLGGLTDLPESEVQALQAMRAKTGDRTL